MAAGPALARNAEAELQRGKTSLLEGFLLEEQEKHEAQAEAVLRAEHVFEAVANDDALARQILHEAGQHLAYSIYMLAMNFDPQLIVIGGGLAIEGSPLIEAIRTELTHWMQESPVFREILNQDAVLLASLQGDAGVTGAGALAMIEAKTRSFRS